MLSASAGREFRTRLRVRYPETDRMGVAYHAHYLVWFELGRTELMREMGCPYGMLEDEVGLQFPVIEAATCYRRPARYDDALEVRTRLSSVAGATLRFEYEVVHGERGELLATGYTEHAAVRNGRPVRLPPELRQRLTCVAEAGA